MNSLNLEVGTKACFVCKQQTRRRCSRCLNVYYCNTEHQRQDWKRHKSDCVPKPTKPDFKNIKNLANSVTSGTNEDEKVQNTFVYNEQCNLADKSSVVNETRNKRKSKKTLHKGGSHSDYKQLSNSSVNNQCTLDNHNVSLVNGKVITDTSVPDVHINSYHLGDSGLYEGLTEQEALSQSVQLLSTADLSMASESDVLRSVNKLEEMPVLPLFGVEQPMREEYPEASLKGSGAPFGHMPNSYYMDPSDNCYEICQRLINDMSQYGVCVINNFLGKDRGQLVLNEVLDMYRSGIFEEGQLVSKVNSSEAKIIRSDLITWIDGKESHCGNIRQLINHVDNIVVKANKMADNGKLGDYVISGRTKAMVACYPGCGTHYVKHYDNPNKDGRCITAIYYLNLNWDVLKSGGLLRVFPVGTDMVANIEPIFDRMVFFWSDRRNPHEVQPAYDTRYAITVWYLDANERAAALKRKPSEKSNQSTSNK